MGRPKSGIRRVTGGQRGQKRGTRRQAARMMIDRSDTRRHAPAVPKSALKPKTVLQLPGGGIRGHLTFQERQKVRSAGGRYMPTAGKYHTKPGCRRHARRPIARECSVCDTMFRAPHGNVMFCSPGCRRKRQRETAALKYSRKKAASIIATNRWEILEIVR